MPDTLAITFTDIVESTSIKRRLGDLAFREVLKAHNDRIQQFGGTVLNTGGDSFQLLFEDPVDAVVAAVKLQKSLRDDPILAGEEPLRVRIGIHMGDPLPISHADGRPDLTGTALDQAARYQSLAGGGQVLISEQGY